MSISRRSFGIGMVAVAGLVILGALSACATTTRTVAKPAIIGCPAHAATASQQTQDVLTQRACQAAGNRAISVQVGYNQQDAVVKVTIRVGGRVPDTDQEVSATQELTKAICLREQQAMWSSAYALKQVTVTVLGPTQDEYANIVDGPYGAAVLHAPTVAGLNWTTLSADSAWDRYDYAFLRPYYVLFD